MIRGSSGRTCELSILPPSSHPLAKAKAIFTFTLDIAFHPSIHLADNPPCHYTSQKTPRNKTNAVSDQNSVSKAVGVEYKGM